MPIIVVAYRWPLLANSAIQPIEKFATYIAARKTRAILTIIASVALARVTLLPFFPIRPPAVHDEYSYLLAADTFAHGRLANPAHAMWRYFDTFSEIQHPTYASMFPPAQGMFLAAGKVFGREPWIGVMASMALMFGALLWMLQGWFPPKWALLGTVLPILRFGLFSYWMNTYWGGAVAALGSCLLLGALPRLLHRTTFSRVLMFGLGIALLLNSRPFESAFLIITVLVCLSAWMLRRRARWKEVGWRLIVPLAAAMIFNFCFIAYYNAKVTGNAFTLPHALWDRQYMTTSLFCCDRRAVSQVYINREFDVMYNHWARNEYPRHWADIKVLAIQKVEDSIAFFVGSSLAIPFLAAPWVLFDRRTRLLLILSLSATAMLSVVWFFPHYAAPFVPFLFAFIVQMMRHLRHWTHRSAPIGVGLTRATVLMSLIFFASCAFTTLHRPMGELTDGLGYEPRWDRQEIIERLDHTPGQHLVIVRYSDHHRVHQDWVFNAADIDNSKIIWAREIPQIGMQPLLDYYKNRQVWLITPDDDPRNLRPYAELPQHDLAVAAGAKP